MNAIEILDATARMGTGLALIECRGDAERSIAFAALAERSRRLATLFLRSGIGKGDAVIVLLPPGIEFYAVCAATLRVGGVVVAPDPLRWRASVAQAIAALPCGALIGTPLACALLWVTPELRRVPRVFVAGRFPGARPLAELERMPPLADAAACEPDDVALVSFTSGTTGPPKGVLRTHGVLAATQRLLASALELAPGEAHLGVLPFVVFANLAVGVTSVLPDRRALRPGRCDARALAARIERHGVAGLVASPAIAAQLAAAAGRGLPGLRRVYLGGAPVLPSLYEQWAICAPRARICGVYGATEAEPIALCPSADYGADERRSTLAGGGVLVGRPPDGVQVRVLKPRGAGVLSAAEFASCCAAAGEEGAIAVAGDNVSPGYLGGVGTEAKLDAGGERWHLTGDAGYLDASGRLWLTGRLRDAVVTPRGVVHPLRVEAALAGQAGVERAALIEHGGRRVLVVQKRGREAPALDDIASRVAFAMPEEIVVIDRVPVDRRHGAKTDYRALADLLRRRRWRVRQDLR